MFSPATRTNERSHYRCKTAKTVCKKSASFCLFTFGNRSIQKYDTLSSKFSVLQDSVLINILACELANHFHAFKEGVGNLFGQKGWTFGYNIIKSVPNVQVAELPDVAVWWGSQGYLGGKASHPICHWSDKEWSRVWPTVLGLEDISRLWSTLWEVLA